MNQHVIEDYDICKNSAKRVDELFASGIQFRLFLMEVILWVAVHSLEGPYNLTPLRAT
jgi:hypothetical protein